MASTGAVKKEVQDKERYQNSDMQNQLRDLDKNYKGLINDMNVTMCKKEDFEVEVKMNTLKEYCRESRNEIAELRALLKEQNDNLQGHRAETLRAEHMVEEQREKLENWAASLPVSPPPININPMGPMARQLKQVMTEFNEALAELNPPMSLNKLNQRVNKIRRLHTLSNQMNEMEMRDLKCKRADLQEKLQLHKSHKPKKGEKSKLYNSQLTELQQELKDVGHEIDEREENKTLIVMTWHYINGVEVNMQRTENAHRQELEMCQLMNNLVECLIEHESAADESTDGEEPQGIIQEILNEGGTLMRMSLQSGLEQHERELVAARAQVKTAERARKQVLKNIQSQIKWLNKKFHDMQEQFWNLKAKRT